MRMLVLSVCCLRKKSQKKMSLEQVVYKDISDQMMQQLNQQEAEQLQALLNKALSNKSF